MNVLTRYFHQPQRVWLRRAIFQIHFWTGLALGLYVVVLSITGSAVVDRPDLDSLLASPRATLNERATPMTADQLRSVPGRAYQAGRSKRFHEGRYRARAGGPGSGCPGGSGGRPGAPRVRRIRPRRWSSSATVSRRIVSSTCTPVPTWAKPAEGTVVSLVGGAPPRRSVARSTDGPRWNGSLGLVFTLSVITGSVVWWPGIRAGSGVSASS